MPAAALADLLAQAAIAAPDAAVEFRGADPVVRTRYRVGTAGAAALAACGIAAGRLQELRGGPAQKVSIDVRAAAASLRSATYMRIDGKPLPPVWDPFSGFYPVRDGWISIHCNFVNHRAAALGVLGVKEADGRAAAEAASRAWQGVALEDAIHAAGGCAGFARTAEEWARHPQSAAVATQPLLSIKRMSFERSVDAPPLALPPGRRPLAGVRVLDLTRVLAGPTCARSLAEHGADVLKISAEHLPDSGLIELDTGIGKLSARVDLRTASGVATLRRLAAGADVFSQSYRPGSLAARGFSPQDLARARPGIVCVNLSAWGENGPWSARRGFDSIVQTVSGMALASAVDGKPRLLPVSAIDYTTGYLMACGAMIALARRAAEGGSWLVQVSLARVGQWIVERGLVDAAALASLPADLDKEELDRLCTEVDAPSGRVRYLKPVIELPDTPPHWTRPPVPLGYHAAEWP